MQASGTTKGFIAVAATVLAALAVVACGGGDEEDSPPSPEELAGCVAEDAEGEELTACLEDLAACVDETGEDAEVGTGTSVRLLTSPGEVEFTVHGDAAEAEAALEDVESNADIGQVVAERAVLEFEPALSAEPAGKDELVATANALEQGATKFRECLGAEPLVADSRTELWHCLDAAGVQFGSIAQYGGGATFQTTSGEIEVQLFNDTTEAQSVLDLGLLGPVEQVTELATITEGASGEEADTARACLEGEATVATEVEPTGEGEAIDTGEFTAEVPADYEEVEVEVEKGTEPDVFFETIYESPDGAYQLSIARNPDSAGDDKIRAARAFGKIEAEAGDYQQVKLEQAVIGPYQGADFEYTLDTADASFAITSLWFDAGEDSYVVKGTAFESSGGTAAEARTIAEAAASSLEPT